MTIKVTSTHTVTFRVIAYIATGGGMDIDSFGEAVQTIEQAIALLELARTTSGKEHPGNGDWIIQCDVQTTHRGGS